ncbi:MAG TPA: LysM peptidoglycan-binding domain-containing protein [Gemmatimonadaceae bacterium]|nr:LysM peptidoglycan-binding domain-containing protein [Gemmatimonadaceae bacterium]
MANLDRDGEQKKADFSDVTSGAPKADFSDVVGRSETTAPRTQEAAGSVERERTYTVVSGDSLSKIARREYGDADKWHAIFEANRDKIKDPDLIYPGQVLTLPPNP